MFVKVLQNESWRTNLEIFVLAFRKQMISQTGIVRLVIRLEAPELDFRLLKPVQESEHDDDSYPLLKNRMSASPHGSAPR